MSKHNTNKIVAECLLGLAKNTAIPQQSGIRFFSSPSANTAPNVAAQLIKTLLNSAPAIEATKTQQANTTRA